MRPVGEEVNPAEATVVIDEGDVVAMTAGGGNWSGSPDVRVNEVKTFI